MARVSKLIALSILSVLLLSLGEADEVLASPTQRLSVSIKGLKQEVDGKKVQGNGTVTINPPNVVCSNASKTLKKNCKQSYATGTVVKLTANPDSGSSFVEWQGGICEGGPATKSIKMNQKVSCKVIFRPTVTTTTTTTTSTSTTTTATTSTTTTSTTTTQTTTTTTTSTTTTTTTSVTTTTELPTTTTTSTTTTTTTLPPPTVPPIAPSGLEATPRDGQITLTWDKNPLILDENDNVINEWITSYTLYMATTTWTTWTSDLPGAMRHTSLSCCLFTHTGLTNGTTYYFAIAAINLKGEGPLSAPVAATPRVPNSTMPSVKKIVGPQGDTLILQGTMNRVTIDIPSGALDSPVEITIRQEPNPTSDKFYDEDSIRISDTFSFEPHGISFANVVVVSFTYRDGDLPSGADEHDIRIYKERPDGLFYPEGGAHCSLFEEPGPHCVPDIESFLDPDIDTDNNIVSLPVNRLSHRLLALRRGTIEGCNGDKNARPTPVTLEAEGFNLSMLRCLRPNVGPRSISAQITKIVLHSTANTNVTREFEQEIRCAINQALCPKGFAHYYIDRTGVIVQVAVDASRALHTHSNVPINVSNDNSIGIELFNNVGEPYDGQQITALIQLIDILIRLHPTIERPTFPVHGTSTSILLHAEVDSSRRKDPTGIFRTPGKIWFYDRALKKWTTRSFLDPIPPLTPTLFDAVIAGVSAMGKDFPGLINTQGGDALGLAQAGKGGNVTFTGGALHDAPLPVGINHTDNKPLIVPPGTVKDLDMTDVTDIIVSGTVRLPASKTIMASGTVFISPTGKIETSALQGASSLTLNTNGTPIINGVIDLRGRNGEIIPSNGETGGAISISTATEGPLWIPTLVSRGGDANHSNCPKEQVDPFILCSSFVAGRGGDISIKGAGDIFFSGTTITDPSFIHDPLPPQPMGNLTRLPMQLTDFKRGVLTSGGMGGTGTITGFGAPGGGRGGDGGNVFIASTSNGSLVFRDIDFVLGGGAERVEADIFLPSFSSRVSFHAPSGSSGGKGASGISARGADGGLGGKGGDIEIGGGKIYPSPANFCRKAILGHDGENPNIFQSGVVIGVRITASSGTETQCKNGGFPLYRLRVPFDPAVGVVDNTLGGLGGIAGGSAASFPGFQGIRGEGGMLSPLLPTKSPM